MYVLIDKFKKMGKNKEKKQRQNKQHQITNEESYLKLGRPSNLFKTSFSSKNLEKLYKSSSLQQRRVGLKVYLTSSLIYDIIQFFSPEINIFGRVVILIIFLINLTLYSWINRNIKLKNKLWIFIPHLSWFLSYGQILIYLFLKLNNITARDNFGWLLLIIYLHFATLPLRLSVCILVSVTISGIYLAAVIIFSKLETQYEVVVSLIND